MQTCFSKTIESIVVVVFFDISRKSYVECHVYTERWFSYRTSGFGQVSRHGRRPHRAWNLSVNGSLRWGRHHLRMEVGRVLHWRWAHGSVRMRRLVQHLKMQKSLDSLCNTRTQDCCFTSITLEGCDCGGGSALTCPCPWDDGGW